MRCCFHPPVTGVIEATHSVCPQNFQMDLKSCSAGGSRWSRLHGELAQQLQPPAEHPPLWAGWSPGICCFDISVPPLSKLSSRKVCNVGMLGAAQPHDLPQLLPNLTSAHALPKDALTNPAELGELSPRLLPRWLMGRAVPFSMSPAGHKHRCLSL